MVLNPHVPEIHRNQNELRIFQYSIFIRIVGVGCGHLLKPKMPAESTVSGY